jgi:hypothetical protein
LNIINPFKVVEAAKKFQPLYSDVLSNFKYKTVETNLIDPDVKFNHFKESLQKLNDNFIISEFTNYFNNSDYHSICINIQNLNKILSAFSYVTNHFEILNFIPEILIAINNLAVNGIIEKLFLFLDSQLFLNNLFIIKRILRIFYKIFNVSSYVIELHNYSKSHELNCTKNLETEITNLKEFVEVDVIPKLIEKLNYFLDSDNFQIKHISFRISLSIAKKNLRFANLIFTETNFLNSLFKIFEAFVNSPSYSGVILLNNTSDVFSELRRYTLYSVSIALIVSQNRENFSNYYTIIGTVLNKLTIIAENLRNLFFTVPDLAFQSYYLIFLGIITKRNNFDDKNFVAKAQEIVMKNFQMLIKPYLFYIKNLLLTKFKKDAIFIIVRYIKFEVFRSNLKLWNFSITSWKLIKTKNI